MKQLIIIFMLLAVPGAAFALEQSFSQQGLKATIKAGNMETTAFFLIISAGGDEDGGEPVSCSS